MMLRPLCLSLALALAGCGGAPPNTPEGACERRADDDPAVRQSRAIAAGSADWQWQHAEEMKLERRRAIARCLQGRGGRVGGGVETPR